MRIAVTSTGKELGSEVDRRFGRCAYMVLVDTEKEGVEALDNAAASYGGGAGVAAGQAMIDHGVNVLITGDVGPNAFQTLSAAGIEMYVGASGSVENAIQQFKDGKLQRSGDASVGSHAGMGGGGMGGGRGGGMGGGRGGGMGGGRGGGMGGGRGEGMGRR